jgi:ketosteroid isomerase-like protein
MTRISILPLLLVLLIGTLQDPIVEIDKYWAEVSRTVSEGDFEGYAATYHEDAILVNGLSGKSYPISGALSGWKKGFDDTKAGKMRASVEFRFSDRFHSSSTAHETGIFMYTSESEGEEPSTAYIHFQGLLTKKNGKWVSMMEYQVSMASEEEWNKLE